MALSGRSRELRSSDPASPAKKFAGRTPRNSRCPKSVRGIMGDMPWNMWRSFAAAPGPCRRGSLPRFEPPEVRRNSTWRCPAGAQSFGHPTQRSQPRNSWVACRGIAGARSPFEESRVRCNSGWRCPGGAESFGHPTLSSQPRNSWVACRGICGGRLPLPRGRAGAVPFRVLNCGNGCWPFICG